MCLRARERRFSFSVCGGRSRARRRRRKRARASSPVFDDNDQKLAPPRCARALPCPEASWACGDDCGGGADDERRVSLEGSGVHARVAATREGRSLHSARQSRNARDESALPNSRVGEARARAARRGGAAKSLRLHLLRGRVCLSLSLSVFGVLLACSVRFQSRGERGRRLALCRAAEGEERETEGRETPRGKLRPVTRHTAPPPLIRGHPRHTHTDQVPSRVDAPSPSLPPHRQRRR